MGTDVGVALPPADFLLSGTPSFRLLLHPYIRSIEALATSTARGISAGNSKRAQFCHHVFPAVVTIGASSSAVIVYAGREFEAAWLFNEMNLNGKAWKKFWKEIALLIFLGIIFVLSFVFWRMKGKFCLGKIEVLTMFECLFLQIYKRCNFCLNYIDIYFVLLTTIYYLISMEEMIRMKVNYFLKTKK